MSTANTILKLVYDKKLSVNQLSKIIDLPTSNIYGRISELKTRKLIKKINGKFIITDKGKAYINMIIEEFKYYTDWNYILNDTTRILAHTEEQARNIAKLIYGSDVHIKQID